ncbi:MAG TPA: HAD-IA family hydrolase [Acidimicrobiales bacterium]|nr:HAD-IA family hydrolase [Acidimicrobiales bacterium]
MPPVRAVVFDIGGVLLDWDPRYLYRTLLPDEEAVERFLAEVCTDAFNAELDAGRDFDDACTELAARHPDQADLVHAWKRQADMIRGEIEGTAAVVARLVEAGVPRYLLTNMPRWVFDERVAAYPVLQRFGGAVVTGDEGILKPEPAVFELVLSRFELTPGEALFVDDKAANVEAAEAVGFVGHVFVDATTLERTLVDLDLLQVCY